MWVSIRAVFDDEWTEVLSRDENIAKKGFDDEWTEVLSRDRT